MGCIIAGRTGERCLSGGAGVKIPWSMKPRTVVTVSHRPALTCGATLEHIMPRGSVVVAYFVPGTPLLLLKRHFHAVLSMESLSNQERTRRKPHGYNIDRSHEGLSFLSLYTSGYRVSWQKGDLSKGCYTITPFSGNKLTTAFRYAL